MFKLTIITAALAAALGLGSALVNAQTVSKDEIDMTTGNTSGTAEQGGHDRNELKDPGAAAGQHADQSAPRNETAQPGKAEEHRQDTAAQPSGQGSQRPAGEEGTVSQGQETGQACDSGNQGAAPAQKGDATAGTASSQDGSPQQQEETTGQGQGVKDTGGTAGVKTPEQSSDTPADHDRPSVAGQPETDTTMSKRERDYQAAMKRCGDMDGAARQQCVDAAKRKFGQM
jgi:hypothetical protein